MNSNMLFFISFILMSHLTSAFTPTLDTEEDFKPPSEHHYNRFYVILVVGIIIGVIFLVFMGLCVMGIKVWIRGQNPEHKDLSDIDLQWGLFTLRQINAATKNFDAANKIGEGGFGSVYKGLLPDGSLVAIKHLSSKSKQGNKEFVPEVGILSGLQHPNLVKLYGCCVEEDQLILIYEYMENNNLSHALFGKDLEEHMKLDWPTRHKICLGIARGLAYLHEESRLKIIHRDMKASNVLLDKDLNVKVSDFGLAKLMEDDKRHISTRPAGTYGYMAPEYAMYGYLTHKVDVFSFGMVALEIVTGKSAKVYTPAEEFVCLLNRVCVMHERGRLLELVDEELGMEYSSEDAILMLKVGILCTNAVLTLRPKMSVVVSILEGGMDIEVLISNPGNPDISPMPEEKRVKNHYWENPQSRSVVGGECSTTSQGEIEWDRDVISRLYPASSSSKAPMLEASD